MIRIMILDDDEMYLKKRKRISTEQYFAEKKRRLHGNDIPECGMVSAGIE